MAWIALTILTVVLVMQLVIPKASDGHRRLFGILALAFAAAAVFGFASYLSWQQYLIWQSNELSKLLLPPHQSWDYFIFYSRTRFFNPYLLSLLIGLGFLWAAKIFNKKYQERFFEPIEPYLLATSIFLTGHPLWLFYIALLIVIYLFLHIVTALAQTNADGTQNNAEIFPRKSAFSQRVSAYYWWLPAAILTILISKWVSSLVWWQLLKF